MIVSMCTLATLSAHLDLVALTPNDKLGAFGTVWYDDVTRTGSFEPVGTTPEHQRKGLDKVVITEALRRLKHMRVLYATVGSYSPPTLDSSVMSPDDLLLSVGRRLIVPSKKLWSVKSTSWISTRQQSNRCKRC